MPHFFVIANTWRAHESQKRARQQGTNTILALGLAQRISQTLSEDVEAVATGTADTADECELALFVESFSTLSSQLYSSMSEFSSLKVSVMSEQWLTANRNSWIPTTGIFHHALSYALPLVVVFWRRLGSLRILRCCRSLETSSIKSTDKLRRWSKKTLRFCYSTFLTLVVSSPWLLLAVISLLDISWYCLLHNVFTILDVSTEWHYLQFYSNIPLPDISIRPTRRFSAPQHASACSHCSNGDNNCQWNTPFWRSYSTEALGTISEDYKSDTDSVLEWLVHEIFSSTESDSTISSTGV